MLERATACLEARVFSSLLRSSRIAQSRKKLSTSFWAHSGVDIELLWGTTKLLPANIEGSRSLRNRNHTFQDAGTVESPTVFLDFLYPRQALAAVHNKSVARHIKNDSPVRRKSTSRNNQRRYNSHAAADTGHHIDESIPQHQAVPHEREKKETAAELERLLVSDAREEYDAAWKLFQENGGTHYIPLLEYLSTSPRHEDAKRSLELFDQFDRQAQHSKAFRFALQASLRLRDEAKASAIFVEAKESNALEALGFDAQFAFYLLLADIDRAYDTWRSHVERVELQEVNPAPERFEDMALDSGAHALSSSVSAAKEQQQRLEETLVAYIAPAAFWQTAERIPSFVSACLKLASSTANVALKVESPKDGDSPGLSDLMGELFAKVAFLNPTAPQIRQFLDFFGSRGIHHTAVFHDAMYRLVRADHLQTAISVYLQCRSSKGYRPRRPFLEHIARKFRALRNVKGLRYVAEDLLEHHPTTTSPAILRMLMAEFAEQKEVAMVEKLTTKYFEMYESEIGAQNFNPLLQAYARRGEMEMVKDVFDEVCSKFDEISITTWRIVIEGHIRADEQDAALHYFEQLQASGKSPDKYIISSIMQMSADRGDVESVEELLSTVLGNRMRMTSAYTEHLVQAHINNEDLGKAEAAAEEALSLKAEGSQTGAWNHLLAAYAFRGDRRGTRRIYDRMVAADLEFDSMTFVALIYSLVSIDSVDAAFDLITISMPRRNIKITFVHYVLVLSGYKRRGEEDKMQKVLNRMLRKKISPTLKANSELLRGWQDKSHRFGSRQKLLHEIEEKDILDWIIYKADSQEFVARRSGRGYSRQTISRASPSAYLEVLIYVAGEGLARDKVQRFFESSQNFVVPYSTPREITKAFALPIKFASANMVSEYRKGNFEEVSQLWQLIIERLGIQAKTAPNALMDEGDQLKQQQQSWMELPLLYHLRSLARRKYSGEEHIEEAMHDVLDCVKEAGFALDSRNWNLYIQILSMCDKKPGVEGHSLDPRLEAFELCEDYLMDGWRGWDRLLPSDRQYQSLNLERPEASHAEASDANTSGTEEVKTVNRPITEYYRGIYIKEEDPDRARPMRRRRRLQPVPPHPILQTIVNLVHGMQSLEYEDEERRVEEVKQQRELQRRGVSRSYLSPGVFEQLSESCPRTMEMIATMPRNFVGHEAQISI